MNNKYTKPDERWEAFGITSLNQFLKQYSVSGKFHSKVPDEIREEFKKVERLLVYSYYYYPLIDEAFSICSRIFESAIKTRYYQLGFKDKERGFTSLEYRIRKLEIFYTPDIYHHIKSAKELRNKVTHRESGTLYGTMVFSPLTQMVNVFNQIFLDKEGLKKREKDIEEYQKKNERIKSKVSVLELKNKRYLIHLIRPHSICRYQGVEYSLWAFYNVLKTFPQSNEVTMQVSPPKILYLKNVNIESDILSGELLESGEQIRLYPSVNRSDHEVFENYMHQIKSSKVKNNYFTRVQELVSAEIVKFQYLYFWE